MNWSISTGFSLQLSKARLIVKQYFWFCSKQFQQRQKERKRRSLQKSGNLNDRRADSDGENCRKKQATEAAAEKIWANIWGPWEKRSGFVCWRFPWTDGIKSALWPAAGLMRMTPDPQRCSTVRRTEWKNPRFTAAHLSQALPMEAQMCHNFQSR